MMGGGENFGSRYLFFSFLFFLYGMLWIGLMVDQLQDLHSFVIFTTFDDFSLFRNDAEKQLSAKV